MLIKNKYWDWHRLGNHSTFFQRWSQKERRTSLNHDHLRMPRFFIFGATCKSIHYNIWILTTCWAVISSLVWIKPDCHSKHIIAQCLPPTTPTEAAPTSWWWWWWSPSAVTAWTIRQSRANVFICLLWCCWVPRPKPTSGKGARHPRINLWKTGGKKYKTTSVREDWVNFVTTKLTRH